MAVTFTAAIISALLIEGRIGLISFVAFLNFTAGVWIGQLVHTLGNSFTDDDYDGVLGVLRRRGTHE